MNRQRYAIYFAPGEGTPFDRFGASWIGRSAYSGQHANGLELSPEIDELRRHHLAEPYRYGFHATLKPPFHLARGCVSKQLVDALRDFTREKAPFWVPPLVVGEIDGFLALVPAVRSPLLEQLAGECVRQFDSFRAPPTESEMAKRRLAKLSPRQEKLLQDWGYPYVMEEFRFHMTLTGRIADDTERKAVREAVEVLWCGLATKPVLVDAVTLFCQEEGGHPFHVLDRIPFGKA